MNSVLFCGVLLQIISPFIFVVSITAFTIFFSFVVAFGIVPNIFPYNMMGDMIQIRKQSRVKRGLQVFVIAYTLSFFIFSVGSMVGIGLGLLFASVLAFSAENLFLLFAKDFIVIIIMLGVTVGIIGGSIAGLYGGGKVNIAIDNIESDHFINIHIDKGREGTEK